MKKDEKKKATPAKSSLLKSISEAATKPKAKTTKQELANETAVERPFEKAVKKPKSKIRMPK